MHLDLLQSVSEADGISLLLLPDRLWLDKSWRRLIRELYSWPALAARSLAVINLHTSKCAPCITGFEATCVMSGLQIERLRIKSRQDHAAARPHQRGREQASALTTLLAGCAAAAKERKLAECAVLRKTLTSISASERSLTAALTLRAHASVRQLKPIVCRTSAFEPDDQACAVFRAQSDCNFR